MWSEAFIASPNQKGPIMAWVLSLIIQNHGVYIISLGDVIDQNLVENGWKKVFWPAFRCCKHLKAGRNTQHSTWIFETWRLDHLATTARFHQINVFFRKLSVKIYILVIQHPQFVESGLCANAPSPSLSSLYLFSCVSAPWPPWFKLLGRSRASTQGVRSRLTSHRTQSYQ